MCGIFGYLNYGAPRSRKYLCDILVNGLHRLEYRGYDSAGFSVDGVDGTPEIYRVKGNVDELDKLAKKEALEDPDHTYDNHVGIAHTRWSTHGMLTLYFLTIAKEKKEKKNILLREKKKKKLCLLTFFLSGEPAVRNSHPHSSDPSNQFVVVHNGIISNYASIKTFLVCANTHPFRFTHSRIS